jgi:hypothetical protein
MPHIRSIARLLVTLIAACLGAVAHAADGSGADEADGSPTLKTEFGELAIFPADNPWNQDVSGLPVHPQSDDYLASIGLDKGLHPDFGTVWEGAPNGIPYAVVGEDQRKLAVKFDYPDESDRGPYPIPVDPPIEGGADAPLDRDRHILLVSHHERKLYELFNARPTDAGWEAGSGAIFDLSTNQLRPAGWTSADAAGLPIFPGLARYDEVVERGEVRHALRFTTRRTQRAYIAPATHWASRSDDPRLPPMGLRVRLRADYDVSEFPECAQAILRGLKRYGLLLADNGGDWFISGAPNPRWNDEELNTLKRVTGRDLEAVDTGPLVTE